MFLDLPHLFRIPSNLSSCNIHYSISFLGHCPHKRCALFLYIQFNTTPGVIDGTTAQLQYVDLTRETIERRAVPTGWNKKYMGHGG
jgi:hypothetical protein